MASATREPRVANGVSHAQSVSFAAAGAVPYDDPMSKVLGLDSQTSGLAAWFGFTSGSTAVFVCFALLTSYMAWVQAHRPQALVALPDEIDIEAPQAPPPPPDPPKEEEEKPQPAAPHVAREVAPPPPAPAQAAKVLTQEPDPNEPVDLTANTIVQG